jgi:hypothetical protein
VSAQLCVRGFEVPLLQAQAEKARQVIQVGGLPAGCLLPGVLGLGRPALGTRARLPPLTASAESMEDVRVEPDELPSWGRGSSPWAFTTAAPKERQGPSLSASGEPEGGATQGSSLQLSPADGGGVLQPLDDADPDVHKPLFQRKSPFKVARFDGRSPLTTNSTS